MLFTNNRPANGRTKILTPRPCPSRTVPPVVKPIAKPYKAPPAKKCRHAPAPVAPVPRPFDFGFTARRPLVPLAAVSMFLDMTAKQVITLIEEGKLRWAFDIRCEQAGRREIRVLRQSLFEFTGLQAAPSEESRRNPALEFQQVVDLIVPPGVVIKPPAPTVHALKPGAANDFHLKTRVPIIEFNKLLLPPDPVLRGTEVAQCFSCLSQHVLNLLKGHTLRTVNLRRGPKASPLITRASLVDFLKARRMS